LKGLFDRLIVGKALGIHNNQGCKNILVGFVTQYPAIQRAAYDCIPDDFLYRYIMVPSAPTFHGWFME